MDRLEKLIEIDDSYQDLISEIIPKIITAGKENDLPNFSRVTILFLTKINFIKNGIFDLFESNNTYSIKILFRVLIEHFIKYNYLFMKFAQNQNDIVAIDFIKFSKYSEAVLLGNSYKKINELLENDNDLDSYKLLQDYTPELKNVSKKEFKEKVSEYDMRNMIRFINEQLNKEKTFEGNAFILKLFPIYSDLSSFVHGGYGADSLMFMHSDEDLRVKELITDLEFSLRMTVSIGSIACIAFAKNDKSMLEYLKKINKIHSEI